MTIPENPPPWLAWTNRSTTRGITTVIAIVALLLSVALLARLQFYVSCVGSENNADAKRTSAIAAATDAERAADIALIQGATPGGPDAETLRANAVAARKVTDRVRALNPPPGTGGC